MTDPASYVREMAVRMGGCTCDVCKFGATCTNALNPLVFGCSQGVPLLSEEERTLLQKVKG